MRILFDHQIFDLQKIGGISRYFCQLIEELPEVQLPLISTNNVYFNNELIKEKVGLNVHESTKENVKHQLVINLKIFQSIYNKIAKNNRVSNEALSIESIKEGKFDVFHPTYYDPYFLPYLNKKPFVVTVHDMIHEKFPEFFSLNDQVSHNKRLLVESASRIIAISEQTKVDIMNIYNIDDKRIDVVYHANIFNGFKHSSCSKINSRYILFTGQRGGYKNFYFMLLALKPIFEKYKDINIVCTGSCFSDEEIYFLHKNKLYNRVINIFVNEEELSGLYANATLFIFPSYYEGFGMPILEAFANNCPVVISDIPCFKEVAGEAALYFSAKDAGALCKQVDQLIGREEFRNCLIEKGSKQLAKFSRQQLIDKMELVYTKAISSAD